MSSLAHIFSQEITLPIEQVNFVASEELNKGNKSFLLQNVSKRNKSRQFISLYNKEPSFTLRVTLRRATQILEIENAYVNTSTYTV